ncbi:RagB/SusD family nutrient uptake outer membrane protein [Polaribacter sp. Z014]|uniref:RagB/SusD family nutrient uptake outer membrane protein n=1 Tax=Polaribacter sp. Z014 TaxID=2927126 RepID=UPI00202181F1|nr:RagB/SusD family nutrient uptake outer membrane protein [Polaribacter sp. Z014]MCL7762975.1 RagB/SusD family nutrient uptake outer membrane protein [Polaribacter sp. Z014]
MKNYLNYFIAILMMTVSLQSCDSESYLTENNPNEISTDVYWSTLTESESNLTSVYAAMLDSYVLNTTYDFFRTDIAHPGQRTNPTGAYLNWYQNRLFTDNNVVGNTWDAKYRVIWRANQVIEGLNGMTAELKAKQAWTEQMAQARFFRGLMHFYLHSTFNEGKIVIRDKVPVTFEDFNKPLSTSEEVVTFFREDLEYAYANLPAQFSKKTRVDAGTAATILGTSYLYQGKYAEAKVYFNDVITNADYGYALVQDVNLIHTSAGDYNSESIFEINYSDVLQIEDDRFDEESFQNRLARFCAPTAKNVETGATMGGQGIILPSAWLTYGLSNEPMDMTDTRNIGRTIPLRAAQSIAVVNDEVSNYYGFTAPQVNAFAKTRFSYFKKYTNHDVGQTEVETANDSWRSGRNIIVNRLSGVYLMQAECMANTGDLPGAIDLINQIRKRWGLVQLDINASLIDGTPYTQTSLMEHLMYKEYPYELGLEGFSTRLIDLRRWGVAQERFTDVSTQMFHLEDYTYTKTNGKTSNRKASLLTPGPGKSEFVEYVDAATTWSSATAGWLPLPQSEILNNQNVN